MPKPNIDALLKVVEEIDAFADEGHLLRVVELETKSSRRNRRGQGCERGPLFNDNRPEAGSLSEVGGRAADDAPADDDEVGAFLR